MVAWAVTGGADVDMVVACVWTWGSIGTTIGLSGVGNVGWGVIGDDDSVGLLVIP